MPFTSIDFDHALMTGPRSRLQALGVIIVNMRDVKQRKLKPTNSKPKHLKLICTPNVSHLTSLPSEYYGIFEERNRTRNIPIKSNGENKAFHLL